MNQDTTIIDSMRGYVFTRCRNYRCADDIISFVNCEIIRAFVAYDPTRGMMMNSWLRYKADKAISQYWTHHFFRKGRQHDRVMSYDVLLEGRSDNYEISEHLKSMIRRLVDQLNDEDRFIIVEHFWKGTTNRRIGEMIGVGESRACQILKRAIARMRDAA